MKKILVLAMAVFVSVFFYSCSDSPSDVTKNFFDAVAQGNNEGISEYATEETAALIKMALAMSGTENKALNSAANIEILEEKINGDTAVVTIKDADGKTDRVDLVKVDGAWKVAIKKK